MGLLGLHVRNFRNIENADLELAAGLNVFAGLNGQGKTSLLEAVGFLARGRSFRTEEARGLIRRGASGLSVGGVASADSTANLRICLDPERRRFLLDGRDVTPADYRGHLEVVVYATDRLSVVRGPARERRQFIDRSAGALWPAYRQVLRDYERVVRQRNALLESGSPGLEPWNESLASLGGQLRQRRGAYLKRLQAALRAGLPGVAEVYEIVSRPAAGRDEETALLRQEVDARAREERRARRSLVGPHRDPVSFTIDGVDVARGASAGQARCLLLALTLATIEVYREEQGRPPVALLDDLDSELDDERAGALCRVLAERGQALVTTAHESWARRVAAHSRTFLVAEGRFTPA